MHFSVLTLPKLPAVFNFLTIDHYLSSLIFYGSLFPDSLHTSLFFQYFCSFPSYLLLRLSLPLLMPQKLVIFNGLRWPELFLTAIFHFHGFKYQPHAEDTYIYVSSSAFSLKLPTFVTYSPFPLLDWEFLEDKDYILFIFVNPSASHKKAFDIYWIKNILLN